MKKPDNYNEHELVQLITTGDAEAFRELFDRYRNKVFSIAWKFTSDEATTEDLVQEIFIKIWLHRAKLSGVNNFNSYLNAVTKNHIFNHLRKLAVERHTRARISIINSSTDVKASDSIGYKELENLINEAVSNLPPQQKRAYEFSRLQGLKHEEIAELMGISRSTVKGHIMGALNYIKHFLAANGEIVGILFILSFHYASHLYLI